MDDWFASNGVEIKLSHPENFLKIKETLQRIGIASKGKDQKLFQSCHILHKKGKYGIVHFKELFALDGNKTNFNEEDRARRNIIARLLEQWKLIEIINRQEVEASPGSISQVKIISHKDKANWILVPKYSIGRKNND